MFDHPAGALDGGTGADIRMEANDLEQVLRRVIEGDEEAARVVIERLYPLVIRIVRAHLPRRMDEEDLAQEVFIKLLARLRQYETRAGVPFEHWVSRLAVRVCLDALRSERRRPELRMADLSEAESDWIDYFNAAETAPPDASPEDARDTVNRLLEQLSPKDRLVIGLLDLEGWSVREISERTGMSATLVKVRAFRARRKLRQLAAGLGESWGIKANQP